VFVSVWPENAEWAPEGARRAKSKVNSCIACGRTLGRVPERVHPLLLAAKREKSNVVGEGMSPTGLCRLGVSLRQARALY
jgi:hypothetical protein